MYLFTIIIMTMLFPLVMVGIGISKKLPPYTVILKTILGMAIFFILTFAIAAITGEPLGEAIFREIEFSVNQITQTPSLLETLNLSNLQANEAKDVLMNAYSVLINMLPSIIISWGLLFAYFDYLIIEKVMKKRGKEVLSLPAFSDFSLPRKAIMGSLLIYILSLLAVKSNMVAEDAMLLNVQSLIEFAFAIQGLAVMSFNIKRKKINKVLGFVICLLMFLSSLGRIILAFLGFLDLVFGIRQKLESQ